MPSIIPNAVTVDVLRKVLRREGFTLEPLIPVGEAGADIVAHRGDERIEVEVIGFKSNQPLRTRDFNHAFFQAVAWIGSGSRRVAIALPARFAEGLPVRARNLGASWQKLGFAFPELEIWLVDTSKATYRVTKWNDWVPPAATVPG